MTQIQKAIDRMQTIAVRHGWTVSLPAHFHDMTIIEQYTLLSDAYSTMDEYWWGV